MTDEHREDIEALKRLGERFALDSLGFKETMALLSGFLADRLLPNKEFAKLAMAPDVLTYGRDMLNICRCSFEGRLSGLALQRHRVETWQRHDAALPQSPERHFLRLVVCCLYDEASAEFDTYGAEAIIETFVAVLNDLGKGYCAAFATHANGRLMSSNEK